MFRSCLFGKPPPPTKPRKPNFEIRNQSRDFASRGLIVPATFPRFSCGFGAGNVVWPTRRVQRANSNPTNNRFLFSTRTTPLKSNKILKGGNRAKKAKAPETCWNSQWNPDHENQLILKNWRSPVQRKLSEPMAQKSNYFKRNRLSTDLSEQFVAHSPEKTGEIWRPRIAREENLIKDGEISGNLLKKRNSKQLLEKSEAPDISTKSVGSLSVGRVCMSRERKVLNSMINKIKVFWDRVNNTYPFTFKHKKLLGSRNREFSGMVLEKQQFDYKRVNPNQNFKQARE